jgi:Mn-containing catalase
MSPLVQQFQKALNDITTQHSAGIVRVPEHSWVNGNETANGLTRERNFQQFISRQNTRKNIKHWIDNQHMAMWQGLNSTQKHT